MACHKSIRDAFGGLGKAGDSAELPQVRKIRPATRQQLMDIRLMTHIKNQAVNIRIKHGLNGNSELYRAQVSREMSTGFADGGNEKLPDLPAQLCSLLIIQANEILVTAYILQNAHEFTQPNIIYFFFFRNISGKWFSQWIS